MNNANLIRDYFDVIQRSLHTELISKSLLTHPTEIGDGTEIKWAALLENHLPRRYEVVQKCVVVDCLGNRSEQIDIAVVDRQYSTLIFDSGGAIHVPAESVYAIFEIKQEISRAHLEYAATKSDSVRQLHRTSAPFPYATGFNRNPKEPPRIIAGLLATTALWKDGLSVAFDKHFAAHEAQIDIGCAVEAGSWMVNRGTHAEVLKYPKEIAVGTFYLSLLRLLQQMGTVPALDIEKWAQALIQGY